MLKISEAIQALWSPFVNQICTGKPVYLTFHRELVTSAFQKAGWQGEDAVQALCDLASGFYEIGRSHVDLYDSATKPFGSGLSPAIIIAAQQVLAVEEMVRERGGYSENAYFPRLRRMIDPELEVTPSNPFSFLEFENVWQTIAREMIKLGGNHDRTVTFHFGETGINKARSFPLSQALLTQEDLLSICRRIKPSQILKVDRETLWNTVRRNRSFLRRRSQRLVEIFFFRDRIVDQLRAFAEKVTPDDLIEIEIEQDGETKFELRVFKDSSDWLTEEFRYTIYNPETSERREDFKLIERILTSDINRRGFLVLPLGGHGDFWTRRTEAMAVNPGDSVVVIGGAHESERARQILRASFQSGDIQIGLESTVPGNSRIEIKELRLPTTLSREILIKAGIFQESSERVSRYQWLGGICVDARSNKYLRDYLPTEIAFANVRMRINEVERVNGVRMDFRSLLQNIEEANSDMNLELQFRNGLTAKLGIGIRRAINQDKIAFVVNNDGNLSPIPRYVDGSIPVSSGYSLENDASVGSLSQRQLGCLIEELRAGKGIPISHSQCEQVAQRVMGSRCPESVKTAVVALLRRSPKLTTELISEIL
jgi:hypothetical protein